MTVMRLVAKVRKENVRREKTCEKVQTMAASPYKTSEEYDWSVR